MRFIALLKKEVREILQWLLLAFIAFAGIGTLMLRTMIRNPDFGGQYDRLIEPGKETPMYALVYYFNIEPLRFVGPLLFLVCISLGFVVAIRQFWGPGLLKTWAFTIHRSMSKATILAVKFSAAIIALVTSCGLVWTLFYWYASRPGVLPILIRSRIFIEGWIFVIFGLVAYFGAALSGLSTARWYTTKIFAIIFAMGILSMARKQTDLLSCFLVITIGIVILVSQIIHTFLNREF